MQDQGATTPYAPDWAAASQAAAAFQAYYGPQGQGSYYQPGGATPQHPYMWGGQHMMPYGNSPYGVYPPGAMYGHQSMPPMAAGTAVAVAPALAGVGPTAAAAAGGGGGAAAEDANRSAEGGPTKERGLKRGRGATGSSGALPSGQPGDSSRLTHSGTGMLPRSGDDEEEDEDDDDGDSADERGGARGTAHNGAAVDYWQGGASGGSAGGHAGTDARKGRPAAGGGAAAAGAGAGGGGGGAAEQGGQGQPPEAWAQDEREVKRQRRKQSNRESARRSRLRKQAECEELSTRVDALSAENAQLRRDLAQLNEDCNRITFQNAALQEQLVKARGDAGQAVPPVAEESGEEGAQELQASQVAEPEASPNVKEAEHAEEEPPFGPATPVVAIKAENGEVDSWQAGDASEEKADAKVPEALIASDL
eukprot:jgi/Mesen1/7560/ME000392S06822